MLPTIHQRTQVDHSSYEYPAVLVSAPINGDSYAYRTMYITTPWADFPCSIPPQLLDYSWHSVAARTVGVESISPRAL